MYDSPNVERLIELQERLEDLEQEYLADADPARFGHLRDDRYARYQAARAARRGREPSINETEV